MLNKSSLFLCAGVLLALACSPMAFAQLPPVVPSGLLGQILAAHRLAVAPSSVRITGNVTRGAVTEPIKITATSKDETLVESGSTKRVATTAASFQDKDSKVTALPTLPGFSQLDATSVFLVAQLASRPVTVAAPVPAAMPSGLGQRIRVQSGRSELHYAKIKVRDEADLYINGEGLLAGVSRSFYESAPRFKFSQAYAFSDYKSTNGVLLPYRIEKYLKGRKIETISVTSYEFDVPVAPTLFAPGGIR